MTQRVPHQDAAVVSQGSLCGRGHDAWSTKFLLELGRVRHLCRLMESETSENNWFEIDAPITKHLFFILFSHVSLFRIPGMSRFFLSHVSVVVGVESDEIWSSLQSRTPFFFAAGADNATTTNWVWVTANAAWKWRKYRDTSPSDAGCSRMQSRCSYTACSLRASVQKIKQFASPLW